MFIAQCISDFSVSYGLPFSLLLAGLVGGFTHCVGMCTPFVLAQAKGDSSQTHFGMKRLASSLLLPYHLGRLTTYVLLAVLLSSFINIAFLYSETRIILTVPLLMLAAVLFLVTAFPSLGKLFPWAIKLQVAQPLSFITSLTAKLINNPNVLQRYTLGVLLGFMPCGMVVAALLAASTAPTSLQAGFAMATFAVGTMPALMLVGLGGNVFQRAYPKFSARLSQGAMVISSLWLFALAGIMIF